jgi:hypothetical protein
MFRVRPSKLWPLAVLLVLFGASLLLRIGSFSISPIKDAGHTPYQRFNNTEVWIHDEFVLGLYDRHPVSEHMFAPYIAGSDPQFLQHKDMPVSVYTSFPPVHFVALYGALKIFGGGVTYLGLQIFSLTIHLLCVILLYYLAFLLTRNRLVSILGAAIYIFSTGTLWFHMNVYWAHQLLMPVFLLSLIVFVRQKGIFKWWQGLVLGFLLSIITWTGAFTAGGFALYGAYKFWRTRRREYLSYFFMAGGILLALACIALQILLVSGASFPDYVQRVAHRAHMRSAASEHMDMFVMAWQFCNSLVLDYGGYMVIAYTLAIKRKLDGFQWEVLFVASFPVLESFILLEHDNTYGFGRLKWLIPVILVIVILGAKLAKTKKGRIKLGVAVALASVLHAVLYLLIFKAGG